MSGGITILGTGSAIPKRVVTNDDMALIVETSDEWIVERTGIRERRHADDETTLSLAVEAGAAALAAVLAAVDNAGNSAVVSADAANSDAASSISVIICATATTELRCPPLACQVQRDLGLPNQILAFDLNAACSGWLYALITARGLLDNGQRALVIGSELLSRVTNFEDRSTCVLFGDAAGAVVIQGTSAASNRFFSTSSCNGNDQALRIDQYIEMDGPAVFKFAVESLAASVRNVADQAGVELEQIDHFFCHQANRRIIASAAKRLGVPLKRFFINLEHYGNTSAASIPLALDEAVRAGLLHDQDKLIFAGFGGGLTSGAVYLEW